MTVANGEGVALGIRIKTDRRHRSALHYEFVALLPAPASMALLLPVCLDLASSAVTSRHVVQELWVSRPPSRSPLGLKCDDNERPTSAPVKSLVWVERQWVDQCRVPSAPISCT